MRYRFLYCPCGDSIIILNLDNMHYFLNKIITLKFNIIAPMVILLKNSNLKGIRLFFKFVQWGIEMENGLGLGGSTYPVNYK